MSHEPSPPPSADDHRRFVALLGRHERQLNAFILSLVPNWADADEIMQETRISLWDQFGNYDPEGSFGGWARTIAHYHVLSYRRRLARNSLSLSNESLELLAHDFARHVEEETGRRKALAHCLQRMSETQRKLLARCYGGSESIKEIAESLGRSYLGLRQSLFRLRTALYECVQRRLLAHEERS